MALALGNGMVVSDSNSSGISLRNLTQIAAASAEGTPCCSPKWGEDCDCVNITVLNHKKN